MIDSSQNAQQRRIVQIAGSYLRANLDDVNECCDTSFSEVEITDAFRGVGIDLDE